MRIKLRIAYDGRAYRGWQKLDGIASVQEEIEKALEKIHGRRVPLTCASRTDAGVSAEDQIATFDTDRVYETWKWYEALNGMTPRDIYIKSAEVVGDDYHPRGAPIGKHYRYCVWMGRFLPPSLLERAVAMRPLSVEAMRDASEVLLGTHDFNAFRASDCQAKETIKTIDTIVIRKADGGFYYNADGALIEFHYFGSGFLKWQVRIMTGTLIEVGLGTRDKESVRFALESLKRVNAGLTVEACGLTLLRIFEKGEEEEYAAARKLFDRF